MIDVESVLSGIYAPNTVRNTTHTWLAYRKFCGAEEIALRPESLSRYRQYLINNTDKAPSTINAHIKRVKRVVRQLVELNFISKEVGYDFHRIMSLPKGSLRHRIPESKRKWLEPEEVRAICDAPEIDLYRPVPIRDRALLLTMASSGARVSEVVSMRVKDLVKRGDHCFVENVWGKWQGKPRTVTISSEAYSAIHDWLNIRPIQSYFIFSHSRPHPEDPDEILYTERALSPREAQSILYKYAEKAGVDNVKTHDFRRFVGTKLAEVNVRTAQLALGHASIDTTARYYMKEEVPAGVTEGMF